MPVELWFPTAIYFEDLDVPHEVRVAAIEAARERADVAFEGGARGVTASGTRNDLHFDPRVEPLLEHFRTPLRHFLFELMQLDPGKVQFHIGRCWPVVQREGSGGTHVHHATFSGVYFLEAPAGSGALEFYSPVEWPHDNLDRSTHNELNFRNTTYQAVEGRLILFSSRIRHRRLQSEEGVGDRIGIAFDLYAMSTLESGSYGLPRTEFLQRFP